MSPDGAGLRCENSCEEQVIRRDSNKQLYAL
jgi:hypothetical protein